MCYKTSENDCCFWLLEKILFMSVMVWGCECRCTQLISDSHHTHGTILSQSATVLRIDVTKNDLCIFCFLRENAFLTFLLFSHCFIFLGHLKYVLLEDYFCETVKSKICRIVDSRSQYFQYWELSALIKLQYQRFSGTLTTLPRMILFCE